MGTEIRRGQSGIREQKSTEGSEVSADTSEGSDRPKIRPASAETGLSPSSFAEGGVSDLTRAACHRQRPSSADRSLVSASRAHWL